MEFLTFEASLLRTWNQLLELARIVPLNDVRATEIVAIVNIFALHLQTLCVRRGQKLV